MGRPLTAARTNGRRRPTRRRMLLAAMASATCFLTLFARLVDLQVAERPAWAARAEANRTRILELEAPRGRILDRAGRVLVDNRPAHRLGLERGVAEQARQKVLAGLAMLLGTPEAELARRLGDRRSSPLRPAPLAEDVPEDVVAAIRERPEDFPGIRIESHPVRRYPHGTVAAHVLGTPTSGVEAAFDRQLRGEPGVERVEVDSRGRVVGRIAGRAPRAGHDVRLTLDLDVQEAAERALVEAMAAARSPQGPGGVPRDVGPGGVPRDVGPGGVPRDLGPGGVPRDVGPGHAAPAGSVVALDVRDGSVLALASAPAFDPASLAVRLEPEAWRALNDPAAHGPLTNRATQGLYAPGSTFKPVTALAGLESGAVAPGTVVDDRGSYRVGGRVFHNARGRAYGRLDLPRALAVSSDVYFYALGERLHTGDGDGPLQGLARRLGFGRPTGIDVGPEADGRVPGPAWKRAAHDQRPSAFPDPRWYPGDSVNLAIGQGDLLVTPLQLAVAYAALAAGARPTPHLAVRAPAGADSPPGGAEISDGARAAVMAGLSGAVASREGTAAVAFAGFPLDRVPVAGKTGTAQVSGKADTSLFAALVPAGDPRFAVVAVVEEAGFGAAVAAPVVRRVIEALTGP